MTKSGSNEFAGSVGLYIQPGILSADFKSELTVNDAGSIDLESNLAFLGDLRAELGGPIIKDKLWFYVGFAPRHVRSVIDRITQRRTDCRIVLPSGGLSGCDPAANGNQVWDEDPETGFFIYETIDKEEIPRTGTSYQWVGKLSFAASPEHQGQISMTGLYRDDESIGVIGVPSALERKFEVYNHNLAVKWNSKFNNNDTELELLGGWLYETFTNDALNPEGNNRPRSSLVFGNLSTWAGFGRESQKTIDGCNDSIDGTVDKFPLIENCPDFGVGYQVGGVGTLVDTQAQRFSLSFTATQRLRLGKALGEHEVKFGADIENNRLDTIRSFSGNDTEGYGFYTNDLRGQITGTRWIRVGPLTADTEAGYDPVANGFDEEPCFNGTGATAAGRWCKRLERGTVTGNTVNWSAYLQDSWQIRPHITFNFGLRYEEQRLRYAEELRNQIDNLTGDFRGKNAMIMKNMWAPRLGFIYDWTKEGRSKIFGSFGRFYESIPMDINERSFGGEVSYRETYNPSNCSGVDDPESGSTGGATGFQCFTSPNEDKYFGRDILGKWCFGRIGN